MKTMNPAALERGRVRNIVATTKQLDSSDLNRNPSENLAARKLSQRFAMPASTARLIAELAGLGPRTDREAVFPYPAISQPLAGSLTHGA